MLDLVLEQLLWMMVWYMCLGTRVQDSTICLNVPDIIDIHAIFESADTSDPTPPKAILNSIVSPSATTSEFIIGEEIRGESSGAVAIVAEKLSSLIRLFLYKNKKTFTEGETILSYESNISAVVQTLNADSFDVSTSYSYRTGDPKGDLLPLWNNRKKCRCSRTNQKT